MGLGLAKDLGLPLATGSGLVKLRPANYGSKGSGAGGIAFWCAAIARFRSSRSMSCFRRSRARRLLAASGVGCKDRGVFRLPFFFKMFVPGMVWIKDIAFLIGRSR